MVETSSYANCIFVFFEARLKVRNHLWCCRLDDGLKIVPLLGNMSDGVDGGGGENEVDSHSSSQAEAGNSSNHREEETLDPDNEAALNTNYDSSDGAVPAFR